MYGFIINIITMLKLTSKGVFLDIWEQQQQFIDPYFNGNPVNIDTMKH